MSGDDIFSSLSPQHKKQAVEKILDRFIARLEREGRQATGTEGEQFHFICTCLCNGVVEQAKAMADDLLRPCRLDDPAFVAIAMHPAPTIEQLRQRLAYTASRPARS